VRAWTISLRKIKLSLFDGPGGTKGLLQLVFGGHGEWLGQDQWDDSCESHFLGEHSELRAVINSTAADLAVEKGIIVNGVRVTSLRRSDKLGDLMDRLAAERGVPLEAQALLIPCGDVRLDTDGGKDEATLKDLAELRMRFQDQNSGALVLLDTRDPAQAKVAAKPSFWPKYKARQQSKAAGGLVPLIWSRC
jgi:hypothetical protein